MIVAKFKKKRANFVSLAISGHAGCGELGSDLVCASVSSALQMLVNGLIEVLKLNCVVNTEDNLVLLEISKGNEEPQLSAGYAFMQAFCLHLRLLSKEYEKAVSVIISEV